MYNIYNIYNYVIHILYIYRTVTEITYFLNISDIYIYIYIYIKVLRFLCKPSFTMYCPSLEYEGIIFSKKSYLKSFSWGRLLEKIYWERYMEGLMIRS